MNKNIYKAVLITLTIFCIIGGTIYHVVSYFSYGLNLPFKQISQDIISYERETYSSDLDPFHTVTIHGTISDITVEVGDTYHISYDCVSYLVPKINQLTNDSTIEIIQPKLPTFQKGIHNNGCNITLTIPADQSLSSLTITNNVGDIFVNGMTIEDASIDSDVGDITITECQFNASTITVDVGDAQAHSCSLGQCTTSSNVGDINFTTCGYKNLDATSDIGDISLSLERPASSYSIDLSCDIGTVTVNGTDYRKEFHSPSKENPSGTISASSSTGDIDLRD